jgi:hypothetical protein
MRLLLSTGVETVNGWLLEAPVQAYMLSGPKTGNSLIWDHLPRHMGLEGELTHIAGSTLLQTLELNKCFLTDQRITHDDGL